jgi:hypothetical protein
VDSQTVVAELRALIGTPEFAETIRSNYTNANAYLEALAEDWASDVAVRLAETKANSIVLSSLPTGVQASRDNLPNASRDGRGKMWSRG